MIDYAANERGNPTHWLELVGIEQKDMVVIDVGYSSERWGSPAVRRLFTRADIRDIFAKMRAQAHSGIVMDVPIDSGEWYKFPQWKMKKFFELWTQEYKKHFSPAKSLQK
jgi:hypothetical protein